MAEHPEDSGEEVYSFSEEEIVPENVETQEDENRTATDNIQRIVAEHKILEQPHNTEHSYNLQ